MRRLLEGVRSLMEGAALCTTSLGRACPRDCSVKNSIKAYDRLVGNPDLIAGMPQLFKVIANRLCQTKPYPIILVDWTEFRDHAIFVAAVAYQGRAIPIFMQAYPRCLLNNPNIHQRALDTIIHHILPPHTQPVFVTDAGFETPWIVQLCDRGLGGLARVRHQVQVRLADDQDKAQRAAQRAQSPKDQRKALEQGWQNNKALHSKATRQPKDLGPAQLRKGDPIVVQLSCVKKPPQGRHEFGRRGQISQRTETNKYRSGALEPWLIASPLGFDASTVCDGYAYRMQVEETIRDVKSLTTGLGLHHSRARLSSHLTGLLILGSLALLGLFIVGQAAEQAQIQHRYQANTTKNRRVLSIVSLAREILKSRKPIPKLDLKAAWEAIVQALPQIEPG